MNYKIFIYFVLFKSTLIKCLSIKNNKIILKSNRIIQINGFNYKEINCNENYCSSINEVTCLNKSNLIDSCLITNLNSFYFNQIITNDFINCDNSSKCFITFNLSFAIKYPKILNLIEFMNKQNQNSNNSSINYRKIIFDQFWSDLKKLYQINKFDFLLFNFIVLIFVVAILRILYGAYQDCCGEDAIFNNCLCFRNDYVDLESDLNSDRQENIQRNNFNVIATTGNSLGTTYSVSNSQQSSHPINSPQYDFAFNESIENDNNFLPDPPPSYAEIFPTNHQNNQN